MVKKFVPRKNTAICLKDDPYIRGFIYDKKGKDRFAVATTEGDGIYTKKELQKEWEKC